jgi:hypothetical protein
MISDRFNQEKRLIEKSSVSDKLVIKADPPGDKLPTILAAFIHYRLEWMKQLTTVSGDSSLSLGSEAILLLQTSITYDRKLMMDCAQWFTEHPKFANLTDQTLS